MAGGGYRVAGWCLWDVEFWGTDGISGTGRAGGACGIFSPGRAAGACGFWESAWDIRHGMTGVVSVGLDVG